MPNDVFEVGNGVPANFNDGSVELSVNGTKKGRVKTNGQTLGQFLDYQARVYGIKNFSAFVDGMKLTPQSSAISQAVTAKAIEIVAKDSRG